jgi:uridine kinase
MKVALLISGYLRSYDINLQFIEDEILNKFEYVDTFIHITKNENSEDKYFNLINEESDVKSISATLKPISTLIENNLNYSEDVIINNLYNQWGKLFKLNELKKINEKINNFKYDLVIRFRPDLNIKDKNIFDGIDLRKITIPRDSKINKSRLLNTGDGHICDAFSFGGSEVMDKYFDIYLNLKWLVKEFGNVSETILAKYLDSFNVDYILKDIDYGFILSKCNVFAICGDSGSGKTMLGSLLKELFSNSFMLECDRYHKWERGNKKWDDITHLNPDANYITKMNEDIFNLRVGKYIYQVDYNHNTGKFTDKELINTSDNLIVCGLHSLYTDSIYDLKIFMDTDDILKKKWKIRRDIKERGYEIDNVLNHIKNRGEDFDKYVYPQRNNADIIIKFSSNVEIDLNDYQAPDDLNLELLISTKFDLSDILTIFDDMDINYNVKKTSDFTEIFFDKYGELKSMKLPMTKTFYDYIIFIIFNLINKDKKI